MLSISTNYNVKWVFIDNQNYAVTECKKIINIKRNTLVKRTINGGSIGWWIGGKFIIQSKINSMVEIIKINKCPF